ncbi:MAG: flavin reductase family protein [Candidatus Rokubacteria bacterium]|nr:flavin reductase family protein [Candidatus Rokubacteria bacterium]
MLGHFASGVTVVTTRDSEGQPAGLTANAFSSVSLDPPLVLVCVSHKAQSYPALRDSRRFAINILSEAQEAVSQRFASPPVASNAEKFDGLPYRCGVLDLPILDAALAHLECETRHAYPGGDHTILVGQVESAGISADNQLEPLLYYRGRYRRLGV